MAIGQRLRQHLTTILGPSQQSRAGADRSGASVKAENIAVTTKFALTRVLLYNEDGHGKKFVRTA
jgi:hypothetical protein